MEDSLLCHGEGSQGNPSVFRTTERRYSCLEVSRLYGTCGSCAHAGSVVHVRLWCACGLVGTCSQTSQIFPSCHLHPALCRPLRGELETRSLSAHSTLVFTFLHTRYLWVCGYLPVKKYGLNVFRVIMCVRLLKKPRQKRRRKLGMRTAKVQVKYSSGEVENNSFPMFYVRCRLQVAGLRGLSKIVVIA